MGKTYVNIALSPKTHEDILVLKIKCKAKSAEEVVKQGVKLLKEKLKHGSNF